MPHILVLDWDQREIRYVLGQTSGRSVRVLAMDTLSLPSADEAPQQVEQAFAAEIKGLLTHWKAGRARVLVALPRSGVELLYLTLPPASDEELPELVANQAVQESPTISEQTLLDFLPAAGGPEAPRSVLVAALAEEEQQRIRGRLAAAGLTPRRIVLRPLGGASLFRRLISASEQTCLLIDRVGQDLELNVVAPNRLGFTRTVRLPEQVSDEDVADRLVAEAKRTVLATPREHMGEEGIRKVYVFGRPVDYESLAADIGSDLSLAVEVLDPLDGVEAPDAAIPPQPERFAPLLGVLLDEAAGSHPIDFLHPRRRPHPWARWRLAALAAGGLALVALALALYVGSSLAEVNADNQRLAARLRDLNETARKAVKQKNRIEAIAAWKNRDVNWLEELRDLSVRFPGPRDAVVLRMSMRPSQGAGGLIDLQGLVRDPKVVVNLERQVRDDFRTVRSRRVQQRTQDDDYTWLYETSVSVAPRRPDQYAVQPADATNAEHAAAAAPPPSVVPQALIPHPSSFISHPSSLRPADCIETGLARRQAEGGEAMTHPPASPSPSARYRTLGLAAALFVMIAYFGGEWLIDHLIQGPIEAARSRRTQLERDVQQRETSLQRLREASKLLTRWEDQSLPADTEAARSLYQAWLVELVDDVGLAGPSVASSEPVARAGLYYTLSFSVRRTRHLGGVDPVLVCLLPSRPVASTPLVDHHPLAAFRGVGPVAGHRNADPRTGRRDGSEAGCLLDCRERLRAIPPPDVAGFRPAGLRQPRSLPDHRPPQLVRSGRRLRPHRPHVLDLDHPGQRRAGSVVHEPGHGRSGETPRRRPSGTRPTHLPPGRGSRHGRDHRNRRRALAAGPGRQNHRGPRPAPGVLSGSEIGNSQDFFSRVRRSRENPRCGFDAKPGISSGS